MTAPQGAIMAALVTRVADEFAEILRSELTADEFAEMQRDNQMPKYATGCCASHNYVDANMSMDLALRRVLGESFEIDADDEEQARFWNAAWESARQRHLGAPQGR